eukprot:4360966-Ditylum_brightwellii.AAC.1
MTNDIALDLTDEPVAENIEPDLIDEPVTDSRQLPPSFLTGAAVVQKGGKEEVERQMKHVCLNPVLVLEVDNVVVVDDMEGGRVVEEDCVKISSYLTCGEIHNNDDSGNGFKVKGAIAVDA